MAPPGPNALVVATVVIAVATVLYLITTVGLFVLTWRSVRVAERAFEAGHRPYAGLQAFTVTLAPEKREMTIEAVSRNFGTVPAEEWDNVWEVRVDGVLRPQLDLPRKAETLFPGGETSKIAVFDGADYDRITKGEATLEVVFRSSYKGPTGKTYRHSHTTRYEPHHKKFISLGSPDDPRPPRLGA